MVTTIQKQVWILDTIRRYHRLTFPELSRKWEANSSLNPDGKPLIYRTFNRHAIEIEDTYGILIRCDRSTNEFYISNGDGIEDGTMTSWLLDTIATENMVRDCKNINERILFESIPKGREYLYDIIEAIKENHILTIRYRTFWNPESYTTMIQPYFIKAYKQRWYLVGISDRHPGQLRVFGLDRIESIEISEKIFKYPEDFSPEEYCSKSFGIFLSDKRAETVRIKVTENQQSFLRSLPLHRSQEEVETTEEYSIFQYFLTPEYDFQQELLSRAGTVEVLEPQWLREEMKKLTEKMFNKYI